MQFLEALIILELVGYWSHRLMHTVPSLWRLHRVHHSSERMDWLAAAHLHPFDASFGRVLAVIPLAFLGFSRATFGGALVLLQLHAIFQHANLRVRFGPLSKVISSPQVHHWHHTNDLGARDRNFAGLFPWIDALFGTLHLPDRQWPADLRRRRPDARRLPAPARLAVPPSDPGTGSGTIGDVHGRVYDELDVMSLDVIELEVIDLTDPGDRAPAPSPTGAASKSATRPWRSASAPSPPPAPRRPSLATPRRPAHRASARSSASSCS